MKLIVGLGNPGKEYEKTRHNIGFMCIDEIANKMNLKFKNKFDGLYSETTIDDEKVILLKPQSFINLSGNVVINFVKYYKIKIEDILIIVDDMDLDLGKMKLKYKGSSAGHNGLKNIENNLNSNEYKRLKIGISRNRLYDSKDYVLGKITEEEYEKINKIITITPNIIIDFIKLPFDHLMSKYN